MAPVLLIDAIVRQTTVLIAALATASGQRAQLAHIANQVFVDLARELREHGLGTKVIADMFGMALRTYQVRVARLSESRTDQGGSLWEAVLAYVQEAGPVGRAAILGRFQGDNETIVRGVLRDLVDSGLVKQTGRNETASFVALAGAEVDDVAEVDHLVLVSVYRRGTVDRRELRSLLPVEDEEVLTASLDRLVSEGRLVEARSQGTIRYHANGCVIPFGSNVGWEAAVFDHYQAMVTALVTKLRLGNRKAEPDDTVGGSTFVFDLWPGHPNEEEVLGYLKAARGQAIALRRKLEEHAREHGIPAEGNSIRVVAYVGQSVKELEFDADE